MLDLSCCRFRWSRLQSEFFNGYLRDHVRLITCLSQHKHIDQPIVYSCAATAKASTSHNHNHNHDKNNNHNNRADDF